MSTPFLTSFTEEEFKDFLKAIIKEVIAEELKQIRPADPETLSITEAASFLKLKLTTMYEKTSRKQIPHFKKGNKLYFSKADLEEWIKKGKVKTLTEIESQAADYVLNRKNKRDI